MMRRRRTIVIWLVLVLIAMPLYGHTAILFHDDFNGYSQGWTPSSSSTGSFIFPSGNISNYEPSTYVAGVRTNGNSWNGWIRYGNNSIGITNSSGCYGGSGGCLNLGYENVSPMAQVGLVKWLGPTGYKDLYFRWRFKFDDNWCWGNGTNGSMVYFKLMRIWCGIDLNNLKGKSPTSTLDFPYYAVIDWGDDNYGSFHPYIWGHFVNNTQQSVPTCPGSGYGAPCNEVTWWNNPAGWFENLVDSLDSKGCVQHPQKWHTIEIRLKLATTVEAKDGIFQVWMDGKEIVAPSVPYNQPPYISGDGGGITYIVLGDNGTGGNYWPGRRYLYIDDFVVSTSYVGTGVSESASSLVPPGNLRVQ
jgi:hypothetical protein